MNCIFAANLAGEKSRLKGIPSVDLENVVFPEEGLEALRLADLERWDQQTTADRMNVSRSPLAGSLSKLGPCFQRSSSWER